MDDRDREQEAREQHRGGELYYEDASQSSYEREDERWSTANQLRDWLILIAIAILQAGWMIAVYFLEPGIR